MAELADDADSVETLIGVAEVQEYFKWHVGRWLRKQAVSQAHQAKAEGAFFPFESFVRGESPIQQAEAVQGLPARPADDPAL